MGCNCYRGHPNARHEARLWKKQKNNQKKTDYISWCDSQFSCSTLPLSAFLDEIWLQWRLFECNELAVIAMIISANTNYDPTFVLKKVWHDLNFDALSCWKQPSKVGILWWLFRQASVVPLVVRGPVVFIENIHNIIVPPNWTVDTRLDGSMLSS